MSIRPAFAGCCALAAVLSALVVCAMDAVYLPIGLGCRVAAPSSDAPCEPWRHVGDGVFAFDTPAYPGPGMSMPWVAVTEGCRCLFWRAERIDFSPLRFSIRFDRRRGSVEVSAKDPFSDEPKPLVFAELQGGWHSAAKAYRAEWDKVHSLAPRAERLRNMSGILLVIVKQQNGEVIWPYSRFDEMADCAIARGLDWVGLFGWTEHGHDNRYPEYAPDPGMGGREGLEKGIETLHRHGLKVFLYANGQLQEREGTDYWRTAGKDSRLVDPSGAPMGEVWHKYSDAPAHQFDYACLTTSAWLGEMTKVALFSVDVGADGILYDQLGTSGPRRCFAKNHPHAAGAAVYAADRAAMMESIRRAASARREGFVLLTEGLHDSLLPDVAAFHGWVKGTVPKQGLRYVEGGDFPSLDYPPFPGIFQYTFPELVCTVRVPAPAVPPLWANYAALFGLRLEMEVRYAADRRYVLTGEKPSEGDYGTVREKPVSEAMDGDSGHGFAAYMKALVSLQRRFSDVFLAGRYVDKEGFVCEGPECLAARGFSGESRFGVVVCNFGKEAASPAVRSEGVFMGAHEPLAGRVDAGSPLAPGAARFYVYERNGR